MIAPGHSVPHTIRNPEHGLARDHGIFGIYEAMKPPLGATNLELIDERG